MDNSLELFGNKIAPRRILKTISGFEKKMHSAKNITGKGKNSPQLQCHRQTKKMTTIPKKSGERAVATIEVQRR